MKIVKTGNVLRIFSDDLKTFDKIPAGNYKICFHPLMGFYMEETDSFILNEKPYGKHPEKINKVVKLYENINRSAGIILSGKKGMGKSMFARMLSIKFAELFEVPTIIVTEAYPGITDFIDSIKQECIVLFDEFEKVFDNQEKKEHQERLLGLFDGISQTKRIYVVTVNELRKMNEYMLNRPGRFHYHMQFNHPSSEEIESYMKDKLNSEHHHQIKLVQRFANRFELNYDSLRAISFELNMGYNFIETMEDLNISSSEAESVRYDITIHHSNGVVVTTEEKVNLMASTQIIRYWANNGDYGHVEYSPLQIQIDNKSLFTANADEVDLRVQFGEDNEVLKEKDNVSITKIVFAKREYGRALYGKEVENLLV